MPDTQMIAYCPLKGLLIDDTGVAYIRGQACQVFRERGRGTPSSDERMRLFRLLKKKIRMHQKHSTIRIGDPIEIWILEEDRNPVDITKVWGMWDGD